MSYYITSSSMSYELYHACTHTVSSITNVSKLSVCLVWRVEIVEIVVALRHTVGMGHWLSTICLVKNYVAVPARSLGVELRLGLCN